MKRPSKRIPKVLRPEMTVRGLHEALKASLGRKLTTLNLGRKPAWNAYNFILARCLTLCGKISPTCLGRLVGHVSESLKLMPFQVYSMTLTEFVSNLRKVDSADTSRSLSPLTVAGASRRSVRKGSKNQAARGVRLLDAALAVSEDDIIAAKEAKKRWHKAPNRPNPIGNDPDHSQTQLYDPSQLAEFLFLIGDKGGYEKAASLKQKLRRITRDCA